MSVSKPGGSCHEDDDVDVVVEFRGVGPFAHFFRPYLTPLSSFFLSLYIRSMAYHTNRSVVVSAAASYYSRGKR